MSSVSNRLKIAWLENIDAIILTIIIGVLILMQTWYVYQYIPYSFILYVVSWTAITATFCLSRYHPTFKLSYYGCNGVVFVTNLSVFLYWGFLLLHEEHALRDRFNAVVEQWWQLGLLFTAIIALLNLFDLFRNTLVINEKLPFNKRLQLSKEKNLGDAKLLSGVKLNGMAKCQGLLIGQLYAQDDSSLLRVRIEGHALTIAPPRSGKFVSTISSLLAQVSALDENYPVINIEPKGQAYCVWGRRRRELGRKVIKIDPFNVVGQLGAECDKQLIEQGSKAQYEHLINSEIDSYNLLDLLPNDPTMVQGIDALIEALIPHITGSNATELHFNQAARRLLAGFIAWVCATEPNEYRNLIRVYDLLNQPDVELNELLEKMSDPNCGYGLPRDASILMQNVAHEERGSYFSTVTNAISWLKYPEIRKYLTHSTFDLNDLVQDKIDIFVIVPPHLMETLKTWIRLWVTMPFHLVSIKRPKRRILMIIDELKALGYLKPISNAYNLTAGYGLSIWSCTQALSDIYEIYGEQGAKSMVTCSQIIQFFNISPADKSTQEYVSKIIGDTTILSRGSSEGSSMGSGLRAFASKNVNNSLQETKQPLISPDELPYLPGNSQLLFIRHNFEVSKPVYCYKVRYFERNELTGLYDPDPYYLLEQDHQI